MNPMKVNFSHSPHCPFLFCQWLIPIYFHFESLVKQDFTSKELSHLRFEALFSKEKHQRPSPIHPLIPHSSSYDLFLIRHSIPSEHSPYKTSICSKGRRMNTVHWSNGCWKTRKKLVLHCKKRQALPIEEEESIETTGTVMRRPY